jgi:hypothetical protein
MAMRNVMDRVYEIGVQPKYKPKQKSQNQKENISKSIIQHSLSTFQITSETKTDKH